MLLSALFFIVFLILTLDLYYQSKYRLHVLLVSSLLFIGAIQWQALPVVLFNIIFVFLLAKKIEKGDKKHLWFLMAMASIMFQLLGFKLMGGVFSFSFKWITIALGLSFYSLQNIAYLIEVKTGVQKAEDNFLHFAIFNSFFPKILAGPITTYPAFKSQLVALPSFSKENLIAGFNRFVLGFFKKMVLADNLAPMVAGVFESDEPTHGFTTLFGGLLFTLQVYFDFSAYIDMAIGVSKMFGFTFPENFNLPFKAKSIHEFWKRWNITLMEWLQKNIYLPLAFYLRQNKELSVLLPIMVTLLFSALWHGVGLTFLLWGFCHIVFLVVEWKFVSAIQKIPGWLLSFLTLLSVSFANIFFRAQNMDLVSKLMTEIFSFSTFIPSSWYAGFVAVFARGGELTELFNFIVTALFVLLFLIFEKRMIVKANAKELDVKWLFLMFAIILIFSVFSSGEEFIYARF